MAAVTIHSDFRARESKSLTTSTFSPSICHEVMEKAMAPHSGTLVWKIPWTEEPGGLQSMGSLRVGNDWATSLSLFTFMHWRRKWQPTPVFLPGESQGQGSLVAAVYGVTQSRTRLKGLSSSSSSNGAGCHDRSFVCLFLVLSQLFHSPPSPSSMAESKEKQESLTLLFVIQRDKYKFNAWWNGKI